MQLKVEIPDAIGGGYYTISSKEKTSFQELKEQLLLKLISKRFRRTGVELNPSNFVITCGGQWMDEDTTILASQANLALVRTSSVDFKEAEAQIELMTKGMACDKFSADLSRAKRFVFFEAYPKKNDGMAPIEACEGAICWKKRERTSYLQSPRASAKSRKVQLKDITAISLGKMSQFFKNKALHNVVEGRCFTIHCSERKKGEAELHFQAPTHTERNIWIQGLKVLLREQPDVEFFEQSRPNQRVKQVAAGIETSSSSALKEKRDSHIDLSRSYNPSNSHDRGQEHDELQDIWMSPPSAVSPTRSQSTSTYRRHRAQGGVGASHQTAVSTNLQVPGSSRGGGNTPTTTTSPSWRISAVSPTSTLAVAAEFVSPVASPSKNSKPNESEPEFFHRLTCRLRQLKDEEQQLFAVYNQKKMRCSELQKKILDNRRKHDFNRQVELSIQQQLAVAHQLA